MDILCMWPWRALTVQSPWGTTIRAAVDQPRFGKGDYRGGRFAPDNTGSAGMPESAQEAVRARKEYTAERVRLAKAKRRAGPEESWDQETRDKFARQDKHVDKYKQIAEHAQEMAARRGIRVNALGKWTNKDLDPRVMKRAAEVRAQLAKIQDKRNKYQNKEWIDADLEFRRAKEEYDWRKKNLDQNLEFARDMGYDVDKPGWLNDEDVTENLRFSIEESQRSLDKAADRRTQARRDFLKASESVDTLDTIYAEQILPKNGLDAEFEVFNWGVAESESLKPELTDEERGQKIEAGLTEFKSMFDQSLAPEDEYGPLTIRANLYGTAGRAYYMPDRGQGGDEGRLSLYLWDRETAAVHEAAHWLEDHNDSINHKTRQFLKKRIGSEEPRKLSEISNIKSFDEWEIAVQDGFDNAYTGKIYGDLDQPGTPTEILSMGIERMRLNPAYFAERDPEFFDFIYTIMNGG